MILGYIRRIRSVKPPASPDYLYRNIVTAKGNAMLSSDRPKIEVKNLTKRFGDLTVLNSINFSIGQGELGPPSSDYFKRKML